MTVTKFSRKKTTQWNLFFQYTVIIVSILNGIIIIPIYLHFIDNGLYGAWLATGNIMMWLSIIDPGIGDVLKQKVAVAYSKNYKLELGHLITSGLLISFMASMVVLIASRVVVDFIPTLLHLDDSYDLKNLLDAFALASIGTTLTVFSFSVTGINQGLQSSVANGLIYLFSNILSIALNIYLLYQGYGLLAIAWMAFLRGALYVSGNFLYLLYRVRMENFSLSFNFRYALSFSKIFTYTFVGKVATSISENIDLILVSRLINPETVMILELSRRPIKIMQTFLNRPSVAFMPAVSHLVGENNPEKLRDIFHRFISISFWISYLGIGGFIIFNENLNSLWLGPGMFIGTKINFIICLTLLFGSITYNVSNFTFAAGNIKGYNINATGKGILSILLLVVLGKYCGLIGVVIAPLLSILLVESWYYVMQMKRLFFLTSDNVKYLILENFKLIVTSVSLAVIFYFVDINSWFELFSLAALYVFIFCGMIWLLSREFKVEINKLLKFLYGLQLKYFISR